MVGIAEWPGASKRGDCRGEDVVVEPGCHLAALEGGVQDHHRDPVVGVAFVLIPGDEDGEAAGSEVGAVLDGGQPRPEPVDR